jgi:hypothetical protein
MFDTEISSRRERKLQRASMRETLKIGLPVRDAAL